MMLEAVAKTLPILLIFSIGYFLKKTKVFQSEDGGLLLKLVFFVGSPALTYLSVSRLPLTAELAAFPIIAVVTMFIIYIIDQLVIRQLSVPDKTLGAYLVGTLIANTGFAMPFVLANFGQDGAARVAMWDLAGGLLTYVFVYSLAVKYGDKRPSNKFIIQKILISPPVWALILGLIVNLAGISTPVALELLLKNLAGLVSPLIMLALGLYFSPQMVQPKLISLGVATRMIGGFLIGLVLSQLFGLNGVDKAIAIICASAPIGLNTLIFANMENLDTKFAASLVSTGIAIGLVLIPILSVALK